MKRWGTILLAIALLALAGAAESAISARSIGERFSCTTGEALSAGNTVAIADADGLCYKADANDATRRPAMGWVVQGYASGATAQVIAHGILAGFAALTEGAPIYLSETAGSYTQTAPDYPQVVAYALTTTTARIDIQRPLDSSVASTSLKKKVLITAVENLAADADIGNGTAAGARTVINAPTALTLTAVRLYGRAAAAGIDDSNTSVLKIYNGVSTVVTYTMNSTTAWPAAFTPTSLGALANASVTSGAAIAFDITNGTNADPPAFDLYFEYTTSD